MIRLITCVFHGGKAHAEYGELISQCLPLADEILRRSSNFIKVCICNDSSLVHAVTTYKYGIQCGRFNSILVYNALFCSQIYMIVVFAALLVVT
jgi:hypothetical protein